MWNETLIESMGNHENGKRWLTVQLAVIVHAAIVGVLVAGSFWYVDRMSLPAHERIADVFFEKAPGGIPAAKGITKPDQNKTTKVVKEVSTQTPVIQEQLEPETIDNISDQKLANAFAGESVGDPEGVPGGDPNSNSKGGFGGSGGEGIGPNALDNVIYDPKKVDLNLPVIIDQVKPEYPEILRRSRIEGIVVLEAVITRTGSVQDLRLLHSAHPLFDRAAMNAVMQWRYRPANLNGKPVAVYFRVTVSFKLR